MAAAQGRGAGAGERRPDVATSVSPSRRPGRKKPVSAFGDLGPGQPEAPGSGAGAAPARAATPRGQGPRRNPRRRHWPARCAGGTTPRPRPTPRADGRRRDHRRRRWPHPRHRAHARRALGQPRLLGGHRLRWTSPRIWPVPRISLSTCCSRARRGAAPATSPRLIDAVGGDINAFTTKEYTAFYVRLLAETCDLGLDILSDIIWAPALRPDELEAERQVILDEILMHARRAGRTGPRPVDRAMYPGHPLGRDVLGLEATVRAATRDDIAPFTAATTGRPTSSSPRPGGSSTTASSRPWSSGLKGSRRGRPGVRSGGAAGPQAPAGPAQRRLVVNAPDRASPPDRGHARL